MGWNRLFDVKVIVIIIASEALRNSNETGNIFLCILLVLGPCVCVCWADCRHMWPTCMHTNARSKRIRIYFDARRIKPAHINLCNKWCIQLALVLSVGMLNGIGYGSLQQYMNSKTARQSQCQIVRISSPREIPSIAFAPSSASIELSATASVLYVCALCVCSCALLPNFYTPSSCRAAACKNASEVIFRFGMFRHITTPDPNC